MSSPRARAALTLLAVLLALAGCDKTNPIAPAGTTLTVTASPSQIALDGTSTITIVGIRGDGNPLFTGTQIRLSTSLGTIPPVVEVGSDGIATATLRGDGRSGTATVTATTGDGTIMATADVQVGQGSESKAVLLVSVNPNNIPVEGKATVTVIARRPDGSAVGAGQAVTLVTTLGTLVPDHPETDANGQAVATLNAGPQAGTATITAILGASDPVTATVTIRDAATDINIQANPSTLPQAGGSVELTAFVTNSQGQPLQGAPVTFQSERGSLSTTGVVFTDTTGVAKNTLTASQQQLAGVTSFQVTASTPSGTGSLLKASTTIVVQ